MRFMVLGNILISSALLLIIRETARYDDWQFTTGRAENWYVTTCRKEKPLGEEGNSVRAAIAGEAVHE
ncbi:hypothetical protein NB640_09165 [Oxalobacter vibrioformis]|uniref:Uncharacterized protein n=1 Tax=Oxalobacter vibrioformis TaxID=933080 RepID=A0A9E9LXI9_9BURK|nr:hypothetical protein [Oxalobacter vibrioformis]WAW09415.1 hypothetical protein NB640_09165 [Oxalobacter vibrioformis]